MNSQDLTNQKTKTNTKTKTKTYSGEVVVGGELSLRWPREAPGRVLVKSSADLILSLLNLIKGRASFIHYGGKFYRIKECECFIWIKPVNPNKRSQYNELWSKGKSPEEGDQRPVATVPSQTGVGRFREILGD